jgi:hypothetical protein
MRFTEVTCWSVGLVRLEELELVGVVQIQDMHSSSHDLRCMQGRPA